MERQPLLPFEESTEVIEVLKKSGLLAQLQTEALERLKDDPEFNKHVEELVRESKAFKRNYKGAPLLSSVKAEVEAIVMSDAAAALWQVLSSPDKEFVPKLESCVLAALNTVHSERATH